MLFVEMMIVVLLSPAASLVLSIEAITLRLSPGIIGFTTSETFNHWLEWLIVQLILSIPILEIEKVIIAG